MFKFEVKKVGAWRHLLGGGVGDFTSARVVGVATGGLRRSHSDDRDKTGSTSRDLEARLVSGQDRRLRVSLGRASGAGWD